VSDLSPPVNPESIDRWVRQATVARLALHFDATSPIYTDREKAFVRMSEELVRAIQMVQQCGVTLRAVAEELREKTRRLAEYQGDDETRIEG
jgi:hypothetical protein